MNTIQKALLDWFEHHGRSLPWRRTREPYAILVAEMMLQQTQVDRVLPIYHDFLQLFPTLRSLALAPTAQVIRAWAGLGYNRRALYLQRAARVVLEEHGEQLPSDPELLRRLAGIGSYTAAAVACFASDAQLPVLDTNVRRVLGRLFAGSENVVPSALEQIAHAALPPGQAWSWNQGLMDLGALLCTRRQPRCSSCPLRSHCPSASHFLGEAKAVAEPRSFYRTRTAPFQGSTRYYRGRIVAYLRGLPEGASVQLKELGANVKPDFATEDMSWLLELVRGLQRDGLVTLESSARNHIKLSLPRG